FTLYLVYLEIWVIRALCPFCVTSQVAMTILFALSVARLFQYQD
ncbi:MAG: vitamin K epoxide reductase, partial [Chloroflexi bacterium]|nr:vitamin K epoxide reductase [Chloroflexota bacterium]